MTSATIKYEIQKIRSIENELEIDNKIIKINEYSSKPLREATDMNIEKKQSDLLKLALSINEKKNITIFEEMAELTKKQSILLKSALIGGLQ